ncbi:secreted RxLR effector protein 161-like [Gossypium hirsutum]|uniref:Secreted RxLR effector protein 161-like n=1 Tax=Gossypium hirsutum TaxID=3635 RepID=A0A1U8PK49_GOSHI|nr:secreted RxLR effector protein 161-like [Gossypium hirsutum]
MGRLNFFLGIEVQHKSQGLFLNQKKYVMENLIYKGWYAWNSSHTYAHSKHAPTCRLRFVDGHLYRSMVGMLQYFCITRPNLSFCVNKLSQFINSPSEMHWKAVKRVLRYLIGTMEHGLCFSKGQFKLECYCDADWASSLEDRRSTTGYVVYLGPNRIAWCSKKQAVVSRSSSEAEYRSLANCVLELLWVRQLLEELGL